MVIKINKNIPHFCFSLILSKQKFDGPWLLKGDRRILHCLFLKTLSLIMCTCLCESVCTRAHKLTGLEEGVGSSGVAAIGTCEPSDVGIEDQTWLFFKNSMRSLLSFFFSKLYFMTGIFA